MKKEQVINPNQVKEELIAAFPAKVARKRSRAIVVNTGEPAAPEIAANTRTVPGIITMRGCGYAGLQGRYLGPTRDV